MRVYICFFLLPVICSCNELENVEVHLTKRGLDHSSNIALLNGLSFDNKQVASLNPLPSPTPTIINPKEQTIPVTINTQHLALGNPSTLPNGLQFTYAPAFTQNLPINTQPIGNNIIYLTSDRTQPAPALPLTNVLRTEFPVATATNNLQNVVGVQDNRHVLQTFIPQSGPQNVVEVPQPYPLQLIREVKVPQPYPVHITRTVQVPVQVRVPVEVPKPYPVRVPHPVPVPVHVRVPVTVEKPYPVQITKTVAVPVEKLVYIRVPQPVQVPVPQPYPVAVPKAVQVRVPFVIRLPEASGAIQAPIITHLEGGVAPVLTNIEPSALPVSPELNTIALPQTTECSACKEQVKEPITTPKSNLSPVTGNGLLPPNPPSNIIVNTEEGLLKSYVSSKEGGVYRRGTEYQTNEYKKTW